MDHLEKQIDRIAKSQADMLATLTTIQVDVASIKTYQQSQQKEIDLIRSDVESIKVQNKAHEARINQATGWSMGIAAIVSIVVPFVKPYLTGDK